MIDSFASATRLAAAIRARQIGCLELLDHYLDRIGQHDAALNAVVVRDFDRARERARALDNTAPAGPLHGIPMTLKESFNVAGLPTSWGVPAMRDNIAASNALATDRLLDAGAVIFGKTNVPLMLGDWQSYNDVYGRTNNPWNLACGPGGSSGGSAAALAAGLTALDAGSDIAGSIRQPAHACGIFGHKPTHGLLPLRGHALTENAAGTDISVIGPLARSAADLALALDVLAGPDAAETALTLTLPPPRATTPRGLRVAVWAEQPGQVTDPAISAALLALADHLEREGATVSRTARPGFDPAQAHHLFCRLVFAALSARSTAADRDRVRARAKSYAPDDTSSDAVMARTVDLPHAEWLGLNEQRARLRRAWNVFFQDWDVVLCPVLGAATWPHQTTGKPFERRLTVAGHDVPYNDLMFWPGLTGAFHLPASAAPLGQTADGLPFGVQIASALYADRTTITVAAMLEASWRAFTPPPGFA